MDTQTRYLPCNQKKLSNIKKLKPPKPSLQNSSGSVNTLHLMGNPGSRALPASMQSLSLSRKPDPLPERLGKRSGFRETTECGKFGVKGKYYIINGILFGVIVSCVFFFHSFFFFFFFFLSLEGFGFSQLFFFVLFSSHMLSEDLVSLQYFHIMYIKDLASQLIYYHLNWFVQLQTNSSVMGKQLVLVQ